MSFTFTSRRRGNISGEGGATSEASRMKIDRSELELHGGSSFADTSACWGAQFGLYLGNRSWTNVWCHVWCHSFFCLRNTSLTRP